MSKVVEKVCALCYDAESQYQKALKAGNDVSHGYCQECARRQLWIMENPGEMVTISASVPIEIANRLLTEARRQLKPFSDIVRQKLENSFETKSVISSSAGY